MNPTFLVIGAYKCGSTSLHHYLRAHPDVFVPAHKEPSYWAFAGLTEPASANPAYHRSVTDRAAYDRLFEPWSGQAAIGEVSPEYMTNDRACEQIAIGLGAPRLVAIVRDPIERAFSDYLMNVRDGREHDDFMTALGQQEERARRGEPHGFYVSTGFYGAQLQQYVDRLGADSLKVVLAEDLRTERERTLAQVFEHIGVDPSRAVEPDDQEFNRSGIPSSRSVAAAYRVRARVGPLVSRVVPARLKHRIDGALQDRLERPELPADARHHLRRVYADDVSLLADLTGLDLTRWLTDGQ